MSDKETVERLKAENFQLKVKLHEASIVFVIPLDVDISRQEDVKAKESELLVACQQVTVLSITTH